MTNSPKHNFLLAILGYYKSIDKLSIYSYILLN